MGVVAEPPAQIEMAQAHESLLGMLEPVQLAYLTIISKGIKYNGTNQEQEAFLLTFSEIRGMVAIAQAKGGEAVRLAKPEITRAVDSRIVSNKAYDKFKTAVADAPDPFSVK